MLDSLDKAVGHFFETMKKETVEKLVKVAPIYHMTCSGPSSAVLMPFNYVFYEKISRAADVIGVKCGFYLKREDEELDCVNRWLNGCNVPNLALQDAVDADAD